jgi:hypothetical protein
MCPVHTHSTPATHDADVAQLVDQAKQLLNEALDRWHSLRDPEPTEDNNFQLDGKEYNYKAEGTHQILVDLKGGLLTRYPLEPVTDEPEIEPSSQPQESGLMANRFHIALSFPGEHRDFVRQVAEALAARLTRDRVFYDEWYEVELLGAGGDLKLQSMYEQADLVVPFFSQYYDKPWCSMEWETIRGLLLKRRKDDAVIPVHLDDTDVSGWPAVNFGIRLRGRDPQQIASLILQALAMRNPNAATTTVVSQPAPTASQPLATPNPSDSSIPPSTGALVIWREKLDYLQQQEAITADAAQKFALKKQIEETQQKIRELGGTV